MMYSRWLWQTVVAHVLLLFPPLVAGLLTAAPTTDELRSIASASRLKVRGSSNSLKTWRYWSEQTLQIIRSDLKESLSTQIDLEALNELSFQLGIAADVGAMPSFAHDGARAGYAVNYFCRAQLMADLLYSCESPTMRACVDRLLGGADACRISSLGGGPGFDFVAAALLATYYSQQQGMILPTCLQATIFDYEQGWEPLAHDMATSVANVLRDDSHSCDFATCDITVPLSDPVNQQCQRQVDETDIWFCSYCVAENAQKLRETDYIFFRQLFEQAKQESLFVFTETTHRMWPELARIASDGFHVSFPSRFPNQTGKRQFVLCKQESTTMGREQEALCVLFERDNHLHEQKIKNGTIRQVRKVRGAK